MLHHQLIAAVASAPDDKSGVASGVYKMASSLGNAFGVAVSGTVYTVLAANLKFELRWFYRYDV